jgi:glycosyltransferase involved in cell wall biosynthesis
MLAGTAGVPSTLRDFQDGGLALSLRSRTGKPALRETPPEVGEYLPQLTPENTEFVCLSFEGPDRYARAGGLGVRVTELTRSLAEQGFRTDLYFVGDPDADPVERAGSLPLFYHRWCQWLSRQHRMGVYDGEFAKIHDYRTSLPQRLLEDRIRPAVARGKRVIILSEEWHTASTACDLSDLLWREGLRDKVTMVWNANNTLGFEHVDFARLQFTQSVSTVSRWMKHEMWKWGCNPIVVPNGIPARRLSPCSVSEGLAETAQRHLHQRLTLAKVARFDPDKRWLMAVDAIAGLKRQGLPVLFIAKGGMESHGRDVLQRAHAQGLAVRDVHCASSRSEDMLNALIDASTGADMLNVQFYLNEPVSRALSGVADAMLQNSGREPFGLVGLEVMASGGLVFTGATGEEYARSHENAVVLDTDDPAEIQSTVLDLVSRPEDVQRMRHQGVETAKRFTWNRVTGELIRRLRYLAVAA